MKIFSWMQSKLNAKQGTKRRNASLKNHVLQEPRKEEFSDWPHSLLSIGTFGSNNLIEYTKKNNPQGDQSPCLQYLEGIDPEEVGEMQQKLMSLLHNQNSDSAQQLEDNMVAGEEVLKHASIFEVHRIDAKMMCDDKEYKDSPLTCIISTAFSKEKDSSVNGKKSAIGKKSISFVLKKMFLCGNGFTLSPSLRDPFPESKIETSRMEKIFRAILQKKIHPQSSNPSASRKIYLESRDTSHSDSEDEMLEEQKNGTKWVKTDSEYIVLEI